MEHALDIFKKSNIKTGELEELWGEEGVKRLNELLNENKDKYEILKNSELIKDISNITGCDAAKSIYLTYMEFLKNEEIKEGLKYENVILSSELDLETNKRKEYETQLQENKLLNEKKIKEFEKLKNDRILSYYNKNKRKPLSRY